MTSQALNQLDSVLVCWGHSSREMKLRVSPLQHYWIMLRFRCAGALSWRRQYCHPRCVSWQLTVVEIVGYPSNTVRWLFTKGSTMGNSHFWHGNRHLEWVVFFENRGEFALASATLNSGWFVPVSSVISPTATWLSSLCITPVLFHCTSNAFISYIRAIFGLILLACLFSVPHNGIFRRLGMPWKGAGPLLFHSSLSTEHTNCECELTNFWVNIVDQNFSEGRE